MRMRGTGGGRDDRLPRRLQSVRPRWSDEAGLSSVPDRGVQRPIRGWSIVGWRRKDRKRLVWRWSAWIQLATRRRTERDTRRLEITLEAHCHDRGVRGGRLQEGCCSRCQRGWLVVVFVDRRLITLRRRVTRGHARTHAGRARQGSLTLFLGCIKYRESVLGREVAPLSTHTSAIRPILILEY